MTTRRMTAAHIEGLIASRAGHQVGDYIEPMVDVGAERWRRALRIIARGERITYTAVDRFGRVFDVYISDDPRASNEQEFSAEEPLP